MHCGRKSFKKAYERFLKDRCKARNGGVYIHIIFMSCPTSFVLDQIQIDLNLKRNLSGIVLRIYECTPSPLNKRSNYGALKKLSIILEFLIIIRTCSYGEKVIPVSEKTFR